MTRFIISALGSYGDVHPMVGLGSALARRGHVVKLITNPYFADLVAEAGLELLPVGTREIYLELTQHRDLWHPIRGPALVTKRVAAGYLRTIYDQVMAHYRPGETVFGVHAFDFGSRVAAEKLNAPLAAVVFAPGLIWSIYDSPRIKGAMSGPRVPRWLKRLQYWVSDRLFVLPLVGAELNGLRRELGLPPVRRVFGQFMYQGDMLLGLFPDWFGPPQPDWPANTRLVGFPLWDTPGSVISPGSVPIFCSEKMGTDPLSPLPPELQEFLAAGEPPIAFSPGSANREAQPFFAAAVEACGRLGRRGILLTKYADQLPPNLPPSVRHFGFVPMSRLLPHTAALVHHGGVGSCAQAFAAGVPQLVRPMSYDQFDNARRVVRLGCGEEISVRHSDGATIAAALDRLLASPAVAANCRDYAARSGGPASLEAACDALEELAHRTTAKR
jgi:UDP:flavonoid glycosyltransferase YjiC (YdhE family)